MSLFNSLKANNIELDKLIISEHSSVSVVTIQKITNILISIVES